MTMPKTAEVVRSYGRLPEEMTSGQLDQALDALRADLPGDPIGYVLRAIPVSEHCECGAVHLSVDDPLLDADTRGSLHRLLATPFGDIMRERVRRDAELKTIRFGWSGLEAYVPAFSSAVDRLGVQLSSGMSLTDDELHQVIVALRDDLPGMMRMLDDSLDALSVNAVSPHAGESGKLEWKALIDQVMFAFSTPVRKYLDEYARRNYGGARVGAVNCCIIMSDVSDGSTWQRRWFGEQVDQQLTPDC